MILYPLYKSPENERTPFDEYKDEAKEIPELTSIESQVKACYEQYENEVNNHRVHMINPHGFVSPEKDKLKELYSSKSNVAKKIRSHHNEFTSTLRRTYHNKCPYCVLSEPNTLEHILPKEKYPEYAIHVYNLIPCCSKCNSHKGESIIDNTTGLPQTLNLYYHNPEKFQFLQVDCNLDPFGKPKFSYNLSFPEDADPDLSAVIKNHFNRLRLIERYNEEAVREYAVIEPTIFTFCKGKKFEDALSSISDYIHVLSSNYGINHYLVALYNCILTSTQYHHYLLNLCNP